MLPKHVRYQTALLADVRIRGQGRGRTDDTQVFTLVLYRLSYPTRELRALRDSNPC